jgi:hypothetical protein
MLDVLPWKPGDADDPPARNLHWLLRSLSEQDAVRIDCGRIDPRRDGGQARPGWLYDSFFRGGEIYQDKDRRAGRRFVTRGGYAVPLPPGRYDIELQFAQESPESEACRMFSVWVESRESIDSTIADTEVADGLLDIELVPLHERPVVLSIEIRVSGS